MYAIRSYYAKPTQQPPPKRQQATSDGTTLGNPDEQTPTPRPLSEQERLQRAIAKVQDLIADRHSDSRALSAAGAKDAERQVLDRKVAAGLVRAHHPAP